MSDQWLEPMSDLTNAIMTLRHLGMSRTEVEDLINNDLDNADDEYGDTE